MSTPFAVALELPAAHRYLNIATACIAAWIERIEDVPDRGMVSYALQLAVQETCANIVDHAYAGAEDGRIHIELSVQAEPRCLVAEIYDAGRPFEPGQARQPDLEHGQERGYGLFLMNQLMDVVTYERLPGRNHWRLIKHF